MSIIGTDSNDILDGTLGDDTIDGGAGDDTLRGLAGNDLLIGGAGADTYLLPKGFGQDSIAVGSSDVIVLDVPISDLIVGPWGAPAAFTVVLSFKNSTDSLTLSRADYDYGDPKFQFANGITINWSAITSESQEPIGRALSGTTGNDTIDGSDAFKYISTTRHNLIDTLSGGLGDDTYLVDSRYGYLLSDQGQWGNIFDQVIEKPGEGIDTVLLPYGSSKYTLPDHVENATVVISEHHGGIDTLQGNDSDNVLTGGEWRVTEYQPGHWGYLYITKYFGCHLLGGAGNDTLIGSDYNDELIGGQGDDFLMGGKGGDTLSGGAGADIYRIGKNNGHIQLHADSQDTIELNADVSDADLIIGVLGTPGEGAVTLWLPGTEITLDNAGAWDGLKVVFANGRQITGLDILNEAHKPVQAMGTSGNDVLMGRDGPDTLVGLGGNDTLNGFAGIDVLIGGAGDDTYLIDWNAWSPVPWDSSPRDTDVDKVQEEPGGGVDTVISSISIRLDAGVENLILTTGGTSGEGNDLDNVLTIKKWGDRLYGGGGQDTLLGGDGDERLRGGEGRNTYRGGQGNDNIDMTGSAGEVIYFDRGDGQDTVTGYDLSAISTNATIVFGAGIAPQDINLMKYYSGELMVEVQGGQGSDSLLLNHPNGDLVASHTQVQFADGSRYTLTQLAQGGVALTSLNTGTSGDDNLTGGAVNDTLTGLAGNDTLDGRAGADVYAFSKGDGQDVVHADSQDTISFDASLARGDLIIGKLGATAANTVVLGFKNNTDSITLDNAGQWDGLKLSFADGSSLTGTDIMAEATKPTDLNLTGTSGKDKLTGGAGNDTLSGLAGNDTLAGGLGADKLIGGKGNDTYLFNRGDGKDTIVDTDSTWFNADLLKVGNAKSNQLWLTKSGNNLDIGIIGTQDHVVIQDWYKGSANRVEKITALGDNKSLSASKVNALVTAMAKFSAPADGVTNLPASTQTALTKILVSSWA